MIMAGVASVRIANRSTLHFVYYSTTKKTASGLKNGVRRVHSVPSRARCTHAQRCDEAIRRRVKQQHAHDCEGAKPSMK